MHLLQALLIIIIRRGGLVYYTKPPPPPPLFMCIMLLGLAYSYCLEQASVWAFLHGIFLFWAVVLPFNYRQLRISGRIRYAHIISVVLAVIIPLPAALVHLKDGHIAYYTPTLLCQARNRDYGYYTFVLPVSIIMCITSCLLVVIIWTIFKVINLYPVHAYTVHVHV